VSIENLPVGSNTISYSRARTAKGIEYVVNAKEDGWNFVLRGTAMYGAKYYLDGRMVSLDSAGIRMSGRENHLLVVPSQSR